MREECPDLCLHGSFEEKPEGVSGVEAVIEEAASAMGRWLDGRPLDPRDLEVVGTKGGRECPRM
jgi:hypothetical protein